MGAERIAVVLCTLLLLVGSGCVAPGSQSAPSDPIAPEDATVTPEFENYRVDWTVRTNASGSHVPEEVDETIWVGDGAETQLRTMRAGLSPENYTQIYATERRWYGTNLHARGVEYAYRYDEAGVDIVAPPDPITGSVSPMLEPGAFDYDGTATRNGATVYRYVASESNDDSATPVAEYDATALVSEDGVVVAATGSYVHAQSKQRVEFSWDLERDVGAPERPDWVEQLPTLALSQSDDGRVAVLEHEGGAPLSGGTTLVTTAVVDGESVRGTVDVAEPLARGERRYVYAVETEDGYEFRSSSERPNGDAAVALADGSVSMVKVESPSLSLSTAADA